MVRFVFPEETVDSVQEKRRVLRGYKDAKGEVQVETESRGWFAQIGQASYFMGMEKPDLATGDKVRLVLEKLTDETTSSPGPSESSDGTTSRSPPPAPGPKSPGSEP